MPSKSSSARALVVVLPLIGVALAIVVAAVVWASGGGDSARITSNTPQCARDVNGALSALKTDLGLPITITGGEPATLFSGGDIQKSYARDGARYRLSFQARLEGEQCVLVFSRREIVQPGSRQVRTGVFGTVALPSCQCRP